MDLEQLRSFERIVRTGSFSRAAWELGIAQPTISARVQALEQAVGGPLFVRGGRRATLTDLGASFLPYARRALALLHEGVAAAQQSQAGERGRVTLGLLESLSGSFLGPALADYSAAQPHVSMLVLAGRHEAMLENLLDGVVELALIAWPCREAVDMPFEVLLTLREPVVCVVARSHGLARVASVSEEELLHEAQPFLLLRWWQTTPTIITQLAGRASHVIDVPMDTSRMMVAGGKAVGFFPWMQVADGLASGELVQLKINGLAPLQRDSALVRLPRDLPLSAAAQRFVATLRERGQQLGLVVD
ncbi:MAG: LysR family transcriptional regulator [Chloroflexaceae bacterium]|jgi:DNA-binding transcriptional LysR family regulator|nr:LysR family transcriptional regulator [Chloroflexaceae bacterium]